MAGVLDKYSLKWDIWSSKVVY